MRLSNIICPVHPWLCKPEGKVTVVFRSVLCWYAERDRFQSPFLLSLIQNTSAVHITPLRTSHWSCMAISSPAAGGKTPTEAQRNISQVPPSLLRWWVCIRVDNLKLIYHPTSLQRWWSYTISVAVDFCDGEKSLLVLGIGGQTPLLSPAQSSWQLRNPLPTFLVPWSAEPILDQIVNVLLVGLQLDGWWLNG